MSNEVLEELAARWEFSDVPGKKAYADNFRLYREKNEKIALERFPLEVRDAVAQKHWNDVRLYLRMRAFELDQLSEEVANNVEGRALQALAAATLGAKAIPWNRLYDLDDCSKPSPQQMPVFMYSQMEKRCLDTLADILTPIGIGSLDTDLVMATFDQKPDTPKDLHSVGFRWTNGCCFQRLRNQKVPRSENGWDLIQLHRST